MKAGNTTNIKYQLRDDKIITSYPRNEINSISNNALRIFWHVIKTILRGVLKKTDIFNVPTKVIHIHYVIGHLKMDFGKSHNTSPPPPHKVLPQLWSTEVLLVSCYNLLLVHNHKTRHWSSVNSLRQDICIRIVDKYTNTVLV